MDTPKANGSAARLPAGVPEEVQLLDECWLAAQLAQGARLALIGPDDFAEFERTPRGLGEEAE